jgi:hypothetical protein
MFQRAALIFAGGDDLNFIIEASVCKKPPSPGVDEEQDGENQVDGWQLRPLVPVGTSPDATTVPISTDMTAAG